MKILLLGARGQVGWQLRRSLAPLGEVVALHRDSTTLCGDLARPDALARTVSAVRPAVIVNAAAYTAVDRAESERDLAFAINGAACGMLAEQAEALGAWLIHYSTDYVFDGGGGRPWREDDPTEPVNAYGASKLAGEQAITQACRRHMIFRTSWVFESWGSNFVRTMLRAASTRDSLRVVCDQWGAPTRAALIADLTAHVLRGLDREDTSQAGIYHLCAAGETNWHAYACFMLERAAALGHKLTVEARAVQAIATSDYPTPARRPANSRLDTGRLRSAFGLSLPHWQDGVDAVVAELLNRT